MAAMKARPIAYWVATAITAFVCLSGGIGDLSHATAVIEGMSHLGYPVYFATILGVWKLLGGVAVLAPRLPRVKEWAYAGIAFDLTGAAASHAATGDPGIKVVTPLLLLIAVITSWALRPASRRL
jgi:uncharacterized membrane protein YphA (DoxX/SURF4 family)